jgi:hypothetical protein
VAEEALWHDNSAGYAGAGPVVSKLLGETRNWIFKMLAVVRAPGLEVVRRR